MPISHAPSQRTSSVFILLSVLLSVACLTVLLQQQRLLAQFRNDLRVPLAQVQESEAAFTNFITTTTQYGITLSYPNDWHLAKLENEFKPQWPMIRLTSSKEQGNGALEQGAASYSSGYQLLITRLMGNGEYSEFQMTPTANPSLSEFVEMCDGDTCPDAQYILTQNGNRFLVQTWYRLVPNHGGPELDQKIIESLR